MDNFFQLLIFLFIIYTVINSLFGKKKPQRPPQNIPQRRSGGDDCTAPPSSKDATTDILQDLFGFKIPKTGGDYGEGGSYGNLERETQGAESQSSSAPVMPDIDYDKLPSLESAQVATTSEDLHKVYEIKTASASRTTEIKEKIRDPRSIKDLIIISEILNKPKALRR